LSPQVLSSLVPSLIGYLSDNDVNDTALGVLVNEGLKKINILT